MSTIQQERPTPAGLIRITPLDGTVVVHHGSVKLAESSRAYVLHERNHEDRYYLPREDIRLDLLHPVDQSSFCPWKGTASEYWAYPAEGSTEPIAWSYPEPFDSVADIEGLISFYDERVDVVVTPAAADLVSLVPSPGRVEVRHGDLVLATTTHAVELREADVPTRYYIPREDVRLELLTGLENRSFCPFKGVASDYWSLADDAQSRPVAWSYPEPFPAFEQIAGHVAFYDWVTIDPEA